MGAVAWHLNAFKWWGGGWGVRGLAGREWRLNAFKRPGSLVVWPGAAGVLGGQLNAFK